MPSTPPPYTVHPVLQDGSVSDILIKKNGRQLAMLGAGGSERELQALRPFTDRYKEGVFPISEQKSNCLPVLLGSGIGKALQRLLDIYEGPIAVIDKELSIYSETKAHLSLPERVLWISDDDPQAILSTLTHWQLEHNGKPFLALPLMFYQRLDKSFYGTIREKLSASTGFDYWSRAKYPKFQGKKPRILLITSSYFLMGEIVNACQRMDVPHYLLTLANDELGQSEFVEQLLTAVVDFKPDFVFTINHLGVDRQGILTDLLERLELPLASWFVDNPHLILYLYEKVISPWTTIFTWDTDNIPTLQEIGFENIHYLSLGTDHHRFCLPASLPATHTLKGDVSFVGNSMVYKVAHRMKVAKPSKALLLTYKDVATGFSEHEERSVSAYLKNFHPDLFAEFIKLDTIERRLAYEAMVTWEATRQYRAKCIEQTLPFCPLICGDRGWLQTYKQTGHNWKYHKELSYYDDLPVLYPLTTVNFNCTSKQMKGAVNQRVFDVPATGSFVLTDYREQIEELFELDKEVICYHEPEEAADLLSFYLKNESARKKIVSAARKRILNEHTYEHRMTQLIATMKRLFG